MREPDGQGEIGPGETVLWQGRPDGRLLWSDIKSTEGAIGALLLLFPIIRIVIWTTRDGGPSGQIPVIEAVALLFGLWFTVGRILADAQRRRASRYTLTDRAAYVTDSFFGQHRSRYPLLAEKLAVEDDITGLQNVWFAESEYRQRASRDVRRATGSSIATISAPVGFRLIEEGSEVYRLASQALIDAANAQEDAEHYHPRDLDDGEPEGDAGE
ncbi:hypothetical protein ACXN5S_02715 [Pseudoroseicyclus sp. H15]